uniref:EGF-like domain-containing protein n=1 Tax=Panagrolaimus superbus TaxID=310955 RepID=A0A914YA49_9BILA
MSTTESSGQIAAAAAALSASNENGSQIPTDANGVPFPLFQLGENETEITRVFPVGVERNVANGVTQATPIKPPAGFTFKANACFGFDCFNNGTCVLDTQAQPSCLCNDGYAGEHCEIDLCGQTNCQNGGFCQIQNKVPICQCPLGTLGANCETVVCPNDCQNEGICMFVNNIPMCHCKDGFIGPNCNVKDNCKDASTCSVFGDGAKCITDPSNFGTISDTLVDSNYSCQCLDDNNQMADCLALALARQSVTTRRPSTSALNTVVPTTTPIIIEHFETTEISVEAVTDGSQQTASPSVFVPPLAPIEQNNTFVAPTGEPNGPPGVAGEEGEENVEAITQAKETENEQNERQQPVFPVSSGFTTQSPEIETTIEEEESTEEPMIITTPAPITIVVTEIITQAPAISEETEEETIPTIPVTTPDLFTILSTTRASIPIEPTTEEPEEEEEHTSEATVPPLPPKTEIPPGAGDEDELEGDNGFEMVTQIAEETTTPHGSLWTVPESVEIDNGHIPNTNTVEEHRPDTVEENNVHPHIHPSPTKSNENSIGEEGTPDEKETDENRNSNVGDSDATSKASNGASWLSWIIAIFAIIILIALIAAGSLFIVRYVRRSRRLHGKYNPAREENAVASTYAMPMTTVSKQERLI